jgi:hypothetical protein
LVAVVGWRLGDVTGSIRENRRVAETWLEGQPLSQHSVRQPWHELAAVYDRNGQTAEAKRMRYRAEVNATATSSVTTRVWRGVERWVTGHGYYPLRTVGALVGVFLVALLLTGVCRDAFVTPVTRAMEPQIQALKDAQARDLASGTALPPGEPRIDPSLHGTARADVCELRLQHWDTRCFSPWWQAATIAIPVATGATNWEPQPLWLAASIAALRAAAWFLTALLVAGFTGLLRRQA